MILPTRKAEKHVGRPGTEMRRIFQFLTGRLVPPDLASLDGIQTFHYRSAGLWLLRLNGKFTDSRSAIGDLEDGHYRRGPIAPRGARRAG